MKSLSNRIRKRECDEISHSDIIKAWILTVTYFKPEILKCGSKKEIERELFRCFKKAVKEVKSDKGADC